MCRTKDLLTSFIHSFSIGLLFFVLLLFFFFFFQAEDGIRDRTVTGVQTCALPILSTGTYDTRTPCSRSASSRIRSLSPWPAPRLRTSSGPGGNKRASSAADRPMSEIGRASCRERV